MLLYSWTKIKTILTVIFDLILYRSKLKLLTGKDYYEIPYQNGTSSYRLRFPKIRGPCLVSTVVDENSKDVTKEVKELMGPSHNFHSVSTTPSLLGYRSLTFHMRSGETKEFREHDTINL